MKGHWTTCRFYTARGSVSCKIHVRGCEPWFQVHSFVQPAGFEKLVCKHASQWVIFKAATWKSSCNPGPGWNELLPPEKHPKKKKLLCSNQGFSLALFRRALCPLGALMGLPQIQYSKFLHLCNKCTTLATPQRSVFSWLCNCEAILYGVTLRNCGLVEPCPVLQRCRNLL